MPETKHTKCRDYDEKSLLQHRIYFLKQEIARDRPHYFDESLSKIDPEKGFVFSLSQKATILTFLDYPSSGVRSKLPVPWRALLHSGTNPSPSSSQVTGAPGDCSQEICKAWGMWCNPAGVPAPLPGWLSIQDRKLSEQQGPTAVAQAKELHNFLFFKWKFSLSVTFSSMTNLQIWVRENIWSFLVLNLRTKFKLLKLRHKC